MHMYASAVPLVLFFFKDILSRLFISAFILEQEPKSGVVAPS